MDKNLKDCGWAKVKAIPRKRSVCEDTMMATLVNTVRNSGRKFVQAILKYTLYISVLCSNLRLSPSKIKNDNAHKT
jgi:hypothetical protein